MNNILWALTIGAVICLAGYAVTRLAHRRRLKELAQKRKDDLAESQIDEDSNIHVLPARTSGRSSSDWVRAQQSVRDRVALDNGFEFAAPLSTRSEPPAYAPDWGSSSSDCSSSYSSDSSSSSSDCGSSSSGD